jgi:hypothetical protein
MDQNLQTVCSELVVRARAGDQNAMGLLVEVGKSAKVGSPRAIESKRLIEEYIRLNPPPKKSTTRQQNTWTQSIANYVNAMQASFSGEPDELGDCIIAIIPFMGPYGATTLANGPELNNDIINLISSAFGSDAEEHAFLFAIANADQSDSIIKNISKLNKDAAYAILIGCVVGQAKRIQMVRLPGTPISVISKKAEEELR